MVGAPPTWKKISEKDASFAFALSYLLDNHAKLEDSPLQRGLAKHPHWMIARRA